MEGVRPLAGEAGKVQTGADVVGHGLPGQFRLAHADGGDHGDVVVFHAGEPGVGLVALLAHKLDHGGLVHGELGQDVLIAADQVGVAAGADDQAVEGHVRLPHAADVPALNAGLEGFRQHGQLPHVGVAGLIGAEGGGLALDGVAHMVEMDHVHHVQVQHKAAALSRAGHHKADVRKPGHRLGHRRAGDAERGGQLVHVQLGSRQNVQRHDLVIQQLHHQVLQLGPGLRLHIALQLVFVHARPSPRRFCLYYNPSTASCQRGRGEDAQRKSAGGGEGKAELRSCICRAHRV